MNRIVRYLMNGAFRATRHAEGCGVLRRALLEQETTQSRHWRGGGYEALLVMTEDGYRRSGGREPKDHGCVSAANFSDSEKLMRTGAQER
jgi:hypothetical protein